MHGYIRLKLLLDLSPWVKVVFAINNIDQLGDVGFRLGQRVTRNYRLGCSLPIFHAKRDKQ